MEATLVVDAKSILGEGPVWHQDKQQLFWVDIEGKKINCFDPSTGATEAHNFDKMPGAVVPINEQQLLVAMEDGMAVYNWATKQLTYKNQLGADTPRIRANDGKCDPQGNFWIGTMHLDLDEKAGALYRVNGDYSYQSKVLDRTISNGLAWSKDGQILFYIDTHDNHVYAFDFDKNTSEISNQRVVITSTPEMGGMDGMCIDQDDTLWIAHWGGNCVRQWSPVTGEIQQEISVPAPHVTSCTFGGEKLNQLFITTARSGLTNLQLEEYPFSGGVFISDIGISGFPTTKFKKNK